MKIINCTQHMTTPQQAEQGVIEIEGLREKLSPLLDFKTIPSPVDLYNRAVEVVNHINHEARYIGAKHVMIGGAPFMMSALERALIRVDLIPLYAFSVRKSTEKVLEDGTVIKQQHFKHLGFVYLMSTT